MDYGAEEKTHFQINFELIFRCLLITSTYDFDTAAINNDSSLPNRRFINLQCVKGLKAGDYQKVTDI